MNFLPKDLEDIIVDYKTQMEHLEKFQSSLSKINDISYNIQSGTSDRIINERHIRMHNNDDIHCNQLWIHVFADEYGEIMLLNHMNKVLIDSSIF